MRAPRLLGAPGAPHQLGAMEILERYPALDRVLVRAAFALAQGPGAAPILCAHAVLRSLADDGAAFSDDALAGAAREAARLGLRTAAVTALDRMAAFSSEHRAMREHIRAALGVAETPLDGWFSGPARLAAEVLAALTSVPGRTLACGASAALLVGYAPERAWSFSFLGSPGLAARRYPAGSFVAAAIAEPCEPALRTALLDTMVALEIGQTLTVEPAGAPREHPVLAAETIVAGLALRGPLALNGTVLWTLPLGAAPDDERETVVDVVRWQR
jgi:hypothetical protein